MMRFGAQAFASVLQGLIDTLEYYSLIVGASTLDRCVLGSSYIWVSESCAPHSWPAFLAHLTKAPGLSWHAD